MRFFNTEGPMRAELHYLIPPLERLDLQAVTTLIAQRKYFVLHAPRQTGKTSALIALQQKLHNESQYACVYANIESAQAYRENIDAAMRVIVEDIAEAAMDQLGDDRLHAWAKTIREEVSGGRAVRTLLKTWAQQTDRPLVLFLDEVDALVGDTLISLLRQLRAGYADRPDRFPQSIVLCGVRDVRDYRIHSEREKAVITGGSAFNVKAKSLRLGQFTAENVAALYRQHTGVTGQVFEDAAIDFAWSMTRGQPWLVNALAYEAAFEMPEGRDRKTTITKAMMETAAETIIVRRDTHIDQLLDKLAEPRVRRVIAPMLQGIDLDPEPDDVQYALDLGLVERRGGTIEIANPLYREVIPRELTDVAQVNLAPHFQTPPYVLQNGRLDMEKLLGDFQMFFRESSESWVRRFLYEEAGTQLLLQVFLQRVVNGGGRVEREYALGRGRTDLLIRWPLDAEQGFAGPIQRIVVELKILHRALEHVLPKTLEQIAGYADRTGADEGHILVVDIEKTRSWEEKIFRQEAQFGDRTFTVWGV